MILCIRSASELVLDGTKCGEERVCDKGRCMMLQSLDLLKTCPIGNNSMECSGPSNGVNYGAM